MARSSAAITCSCSSWHLYLLPLCCSPRVRLLRRVVCGPGLGSLIVSGACCRLRSDCGGRLLCRSRCLSGSLQRRAGMLHCLSSLQRSFFHFSHPPDQESRLPARNLSKFAGDSVFLARYSETRFETNPRLNEELDAGKADCIIGTSNDSLSIHVSHAHPCQSRTKMVIPPLKCLKALLKSVGI
jgi:hypothetical protein